MIFKIYFSIGSKSDYEIRGHKNNIQNELYTLYDKIDELYCIVILKHVSKHSVSLP